MGLLSKLFGRKPAPLPDPVDQSADDDGGFVDIDLPIVAVEETDGGRMRIVASGDLGGECAGFALELGADWTPQKVEDAELVLRWGDCTFGRTGEDSDWFVTLLARRYGHAAVALIPMLEAVQARLVFLGGDPAQIRHQPLHAKAFFHSDALDEGHAPPRYAEVFVNIDLPGGVLQFHEKNQDYRMPLLRALTED